MKGFLIGLGILAAFFLLFVLGQALWFAGGAVQVAHNELDPTVLQRKYEWFKDASARLDQLQANIRVYNSRKTRLILAEGPDRNKWPRDVREELYQDEAESSGIKATYNSLAAEYNAEMAKWNWRFTNIGQLPQGATVPLPREYKPYEEN